MPFPLPVPRLTAPLTMTASSTPPHAPDGEPSDESWRSPTEIPPMGAIVEVRLVDGRLRYAHWHPGHRAWVTTRGPLPAGSVEGWRRSTRLS